SIGTRTERRNDDRTDKYPRDSDLTPQPPLHCNGEGGQGHGTPCPYPGRCPFTAPDAALPRRDLARDSGGGAAGNDVGGSGNAELSTAEHAPSRGTRSDGD